MSMKRKHVSNNISQFKFCVFISIIETNVSIVINKRFLRRVQYSVEPDVCFGSVSYYRALSQTVRPAHTHVGSWLSSLPDNTTLPITGLQNWQYSHNGHSHTKISLMSINSETSWKVNIWSLYLSITEEVTFFRGTSLPPKPQTTVSFIHRFYVSDLDNDVSSLISWKYSYVASNELVYNTVLLFLYYLKSRFKYVLEVYLNCVFLAQFHRR